nr:helix-turn-helix domain-containing protein [Streptomyces sp. 891-h]
MAAIQTSVVKFNPRAACSGQSVRAWPNRCACGEIDDDEGRRLLRIVRSGSGSVVTWRRAQMVLLSAQGMPVAKIAEVTFTSADRARDVIHDFDADGFDSLYPKYKGGRPKTFTLPERRETKKIVKSRPAEHGLPFSTWSLAKLADFLVAEGWSTTSATSACGPCSARRACRFHA